MQSYAIVPAAGKSRRMGSAKLLLPWRDGQPLIAHVMRQWVNSQVTHTTVVVRGDDDALRQALEAFDVDVIYANSPPPEMRDSVALALSHIQDRYAPNADSVWLLAPADLPELTADTINRVLLSHDPAEPRILVPTVGERRGHPVLFPWPLATAVHQLPSDQGLNSLVHSVGYRPLQLESERSFTDVDTPEEYRRLRDGDA